MDAELANSFQPLFQRLTHHQLHDQIGKARILIFIDLVNGNKVVVGDRGGSAGFPTESLACNFVVRQLRIDYLDCNIALKAWVVSVKYNAHPTPADFPNDVEGSELADASWLVGWLEKIELLLSGWVSVGRSVVESESGEANLVLCRGKRRPIGRVGWRPIVLDFPEFLGEIIAPACQQFETLLTVGARPNVFCQDCRSGLGQPSAQ
jgi:hypothetical protein